MTPKRRPMLTALILAQQLIHTATGFTMATAESTEGFRSRSTGRAFPGIRHGRLYRQSVGGAAHDAPLL